MKEHEVRTLETTRKWNYRNNCVLISERFPNVEQIEVELVLDYPNAFSEHIVKRQLTFNSTDKAYFLIDCINRECIHSDLTLENEITNIINNNLKILEGKKTCQGFNTYSCYRNRQGTCLTKMNFTIKIKYKNALQ